jgi:hypothetical protein
MQEQGFQDLIKWTFFETRWLRNSAGFEPVRPWDMLALEQVHGRHLAFQLLARLRRETDAPLRSRKILRTPNSVPNTVDFGIPHLTF